MIAYASRTGTRSTIRLMRDHGWRILISATGVHRNEGLPYAIDNGAWTAFQQGTPFDSGLFRRLVSTHGAGADWIAIPDIVEGGLASLDFSLSWIPELETVGTRLLLPVQDGMTIADIASVVSPGRIGIFIGGSTEWKVASIAPFASWARHVGIWCHVGRVNTRRRIRSCVLSGASSFDGSSVARFGKTIHHLDEERRQLTLFAPPDAVDVETFDKETR